METKTLINLEIIKTEPKALWSDCRERWLEIQKSQNTKRAYAKALAEFEEVAGSLQEASKQDVMTWVEGLKQAGRKPATISARIAAVGSFYRFACEDYIVSGSPLANSNPAEVKHIRPKVRRYAGSRSLSNDEVFKLLGSIDLYKQNGLRDYTLIVGYLVLGRRNSEWRLARVCDFESRDGSNFFRWSGKGHENEIIQVPDEIWTVLQTYIQASGGRGMFDYIFLDRKGSKPITSRRMLDIVKYYASLAGIEGNLRVHDLRHTAAMLRRQAGADAEELRNFLGHSSLVTTQLYLHRLERPVDQPGQAVARMLNIRRFNG